MSGLLIVSVYAHFVTAGSFLLLSVCERTSSGQFSVQCLCLSCSLPSYSVSAIYFLASFRQLFFGNNVFVFFMFAATKCLDDEQRK